MKFSDYGVRSTQAMPGMEALDRAVDTMERAGIRSPVIQEYWQRRSMSNQDFNQMIKGVVAAPTVHPKLCRLQECTTPIVPVTAGEDREGFCGYHWTNLQGWIRANPPEVKA